MRKRILAIVVLAVMGLTACAPKDGMPTDNVYHPETDYPFMYSDLSLYMAESPDGYYFIDGDFLYFIDKETMQAVPLCGKPNCKHQHEMDPAKVIDCDAFVDGSHFGTLLEFLDGHLYISVTKTLYDSDGSMVLLQMKPDGTERKKLAELPKTVGEAILHRGYLYYTATAFDEELNMRYGVYRQDLDGGEPEILCQGSYESQGEYRSLTAYGNYLFFNEKGEDKNKEYHECLWSYNLKTGEKKQTVTTPDKVDPGSAGFHNGKVLTSFWNMRNQKDPVNDDYFEFYTVNLDGTEQTKLKLPFDEKDDTWLLASDGKNLWRHARFFNKDDRSFLQKLDENYQVIGEYPDSYSMLASIVWGGEDYLFLMDTVDEDTVLYAIDKNPTDGILKARECYRSGEQSAHISIDKDAYTEIGDR